MKDNGGAAFPRKRSQHRPIGSMDNIIEDPPQDGMTLRDYFAAKALESLCYKYTPENGDTFYDKAAQEAYAFADAMLAERRKTE